jgi:predicted nucleotide-binding protein
MLRISHPIAAELLAKDIEQGRSLLAQASLIGDSSEYESWTPARQHWIGLTARTLGHIYEGAAEADQFRGAASVLSGDQPWQAECDRISACMRTAIDILIAFQDRLVDGEHADDSTPAQARADDTGLAPQATADPAPAPLVGSELAPASSPGSRLAPAAVGSELAHTAGNGSPSSLAAGTPAALAQGRTGQVFLVHGTNERWRQAVASLLERAGREQALTMLNEWPNDSSTMVAQFQAHTAASSYAVVLLTADDVGAPRLDSDQEPYFSPRARQGVVFAMGVLVAALSPRCLCVLYEDGVELPCAVAGITYIRLDLAATWQSKLLLQLRGAGFDYDLNGLVPVAPS